MRRGRPREGEQRFREILLEDALFLASQGLNDEQIMTRQGYTERQSWLRCLTRAGLPKVEQSNRTVSLAERARGYVFEPAPIAHGSASGYGYHKCRCDVCRAWNNRRGKHQRARRQMAPIPDHVPHGTASTYDNYACRCEPCRLEGNRVRREQYARRKAASQPGN